MKKKGIVLLLAVVLLLVVAVLSLPLVLSSSTVLRMALERINARSSATVEIDSCSIGWNRGLECRDIRFSDPAAGLAVTIPRLTGSQGLLALVVAPRNLGELVVHEPEVVLSESASGRQAAKAAKTPGTGQPRPAPVPGGGKAAPAGEGTPFWEGMQVRLLVQGGRVVSRLHLQPPQVIGRDLQLTSGLADGSIAYTLGFRDGAGRGRVAATGFINLPVRPEGLLDTLVSMVDLQVTDFPLQGLLAYAASRATSLPRGEGTLSGNLNLKSAGLANLTAKGGLELRDLQLNGGFLGSDRPSFAKVDLLLDADRKQGRGWMLNSFALNSDAGTVRARGELGPAVRRVNLSGQLELPVLAARLPGLLRLRRGVHLTSGVFDFSLDLAERDRTVSVTADTRLEQLSGEYDGRAFVWAEPMTLALQAEGSGMEMKVKNLHLASSFLTADGRGDLDAFSLQASADLEKGFRQLGLLFDQEWSGTGRLELKAASRALEDDRYAMDLTARVDEFTLLRADRLVLPADRLSLDLHGSGAPGAFGGKGAMDIRCDITAWPGRLRLSADNLSRQDGDLTSRYRLSTTLDLARLSDMLHNLALLPRQTTVTGALDLQADGFLEQGIVAVRQLDAGVDRFLYHGEGFSYRDEHLRLHTIRPAAPAGVPVRVRKLVVSGSPEEFLWTGNGNSAVNPAGRGLYLRNLQLTSGLGRVRLGDLEVADWQRALETLTADLGVDLRLDALADLLRANDRLDRTLALAGTATIGLRVDQDQGQRFDLTLQAPLTLVRNDRTVLDREQVSLSLLARRNSTSEDIVLRKAEIASRPLALSASGLYGRSDQPFLDLKGTVTPDLQALAGLVGAATGTEIAMTGRNSSDFELHLPLGVSAEELGRTMRLSLDLRADAVSSQGIDLRDLVIPVRMGDGVLESKIHAGLNGGTLALDPVCRFTGEPPLLRIPDNSRVLTGVELQQPLAEGVLARLHPLFGVLARPTGTLDMDLASFTWPLVAKGADQARFKAIFDVSRVNLDSTGVLREVLALAGLGQEKLTLRDSTVTCTGEQGRIACTPVKILVAGSEMVISGSVGMDRTLDYLLQVPVTENLVGREGYRVLEGTTLKVPIRGTLGEPVFNRDMVTAAVSDLLRQAAGKEIRKQIEKALPGLFQGLIK